MTRSRLLLLLAPAMLAGTAAATAPHRPRHHAATDWTMVAAMVPGGGIRIGNPAARAQLVEYGSFTCPHCGAFAREGFAPIRDRYVRTGKLSFEFRPALRDRDDYVAALVARCGGPQRFFGNAEAIFAAQPDWEGRAAEWDQAHPQDFSGPDGDRLIAGLAQGSGLADIVAKRGIAAPTLAACLDDRATRAALMATAQDAWNVRKIDGTPAFYLNGAKLDDVYGWTSLEPKLRAAIGA